MSVEREIYPGNLRREIVKTVIALRSATKLQIMAALAEKEFYPEDNILHVNLSRLVKEGRLDVSEARHACVSCGALKHIYRPTADGRIYAEGGGERRGRPRKARA